jgi:hypothetical protein
MTTRQKQIKNYSTEINVLIKQIKKRNSQKNKEPLRRELIKKVYFRHKLRKDQRQGIISYQ